MVKSIFECLVTLTIISVFGNCVDGVFVSSKLINGKMNIHVYYESQCPYSRNFIVNQIPRAISTFPDLVNFVIIPFGKANVIRTQKYILRNQFIILS